MGETREDLELSEEENAKRGRGTTWPRARVHLHVYILYPVVWTLSFAGILAISPAGALFSLDHGRESWLMTMMKMVAFLVLWEFIMYNMHRLAHAKRWLYRIAHAEHHVAMDFPLGPHTAFLEKFANYTALFFAARIVNLSSGAFIFAINMLMCQCVMEHAYTSLTVPCIHTFLRFNTADEHEAHHQIVRGNYGYAFNWYDGLFGTVINDAKGRRTCTRRFPPTPFNCARTWLLATIGKGFVACFAYMLKAVTCHFRTDAAAMPQRPEIFCIFPTRARSPFKYATVPRVVVAYAILAMLELKTETFRPETSRGAVSN